MNTNIFIVFALNRLGIEPLSPVLVTIALSLIG